jgi:transketolase
MDNRSHTPLDGRSKELRKKVVAILEAARRGHVGSTFSLIEIFRVLYDSVLRFDAENPKWEGRDRCILSKGHGCLAQYVMLAEKGFFPEEELYRFCQTGGILGGHPEYHKVPGIEASTGSLGHGLSIGIGFALRARIDHLDYKTYVVIGDGESNEGSIWEAAMCAGKYRLSNLTVMIDYNKHQSYDSTFNVMDLEPYADKWKSFGFEVREVDGHDVKKLEGVLSEVPFNRDKPLVIICHTIKGKGISFAENNLDWHHKNNLSDGEITSLYQELARE